MEHKRTPFFQRMLFFLRQMVMFRTLCGPISFVLYLSNSLSLSLSFCVFSGGVEMCSLFLLILGRSVRAVPFATVSVRPDSNGNNRKYSIRGGFWIRIAHGRRYATHCCEFGFRPPIRFWLDCGGGTCSKLPFRFNRKIQQDFLVLVMNQNQNQIAWFLLF